MISGVSDIVEEWFSTDEDLEIVAASFLQTLDDIPSESSEIFPAIMVCFNSFHMNRITQGM